MFVLYAGKSRDIPVHKNIDLKRKKAYFALLPVWVYCYRFRGKEYVYHINGQTGKVIGKTPTDSKKAVLYTATVFALISMAGVFINTILGVM